MKITGYFSLLFLFILNCSFLLSSSQIDISRDIKFQKMDGIGANCYSFPFASDLGWKWDKVKFVFDELDLSYIRTAPWFDLWEPENDDANPYHFNWQKYDPKKVIQGHDFAMMKFLKERGIELTLGIWTAGPWLAKGTPPSIEEQGFPELGESIAAFLVKSRELGFPIEHAEVQNEPDIAASVVYSSPEKLKKAALQLIDQLDRNGLQSVTLHLPNLSKPTDTVKWGEILLSDKKIKNRTAAISFHTWWVNEEKEFTKIWEFAKAQNKPVWVTEVGYCALPQGCFGGTHFLKPETWATAWDFALSYFRSIAWSHASRVYHWSLLGNDAAVSKTGEKYPSFYILKHFANYIPKNSMLIRSLASDPKVLSLVFETDKGELRAILINTKKEYEDVTLKLSNGAALILQEALSSTSNSFMKEAMVSQRSPTTLSFHLSPESITSIKFAANETEQRYESQDLDEN
jgi:hypothetical protein